MGGSVGATVAAALSLEGCGGSFRLQTPRIEGRSFAFGHMDMSDASTGLDWIDLHQLDAKTDKPFWTSAVRKGCFYYPFLPEGVYSLGEFGFDGNMFQQPATYGENRQASPIELEIKAPGIFFLGAWRVVTEGGFFTAMKFDILPDETRSERSILEEILPYIEGNGWHDELLTYYQGLS